MRREPHSSRWAAASQPWAAGYQNDLTSSVTRPVTRPAVPDSSPPDKGLTQPSSTSHTPLADVPIAGLVEVLGAATGQTLDSASKTCSRDPMSRILC